MTPSSPEDRLETFERRLAALEQEVERLARPRAADRPPLRERLAPRPEPPVEPAGAAPDRAARPAAQLDRETWLGQRGLLAVGVVAVVLAVGYFLKLAFDRGWISPLLRSLGGVAVGAVVGAIGWRLEGLGLRRYGAALIGTGAAIVYLAVWAAARLYGLVPPVASLVGLALVSASLAAIAWAINVEGLAAAAAAGAVLAPTVLGATPGNPNVLLLYAASFGAGLGLVSGIRGWRLATAIVAAGVFGIGLSPPMETANPWALWLYALAGGSGFLYLALSRRWPESRLLAFAGGWAVLAMANTVLPVHWPTLLGGAVLAAPVWWRARQADDALSPAEALYFAVTALLLWWAAAEALPAVDAAHPGVAPALVAAAYLIPGIVESRTPFALAGTVALLLAANREWTGVRYESVWASLAVALGWIGMIRLQAGRRDAPWLALLALAAAFGRLLELGPGVDDPVPAAFVGGWGLGVWALAVVVCLLAAVWPKGDRAGAEPRVADALASACGLIVLAGVTHELRRHFIQALGPGSHASLAGGLAVSAWWIFFAAGLVILGFRRSSRGLRLAGLAVAAAAGVKVLMFDLSTLDALYRVASVLILGVVSLALAYLYHRRTRLA
jgi:uncharacterized membrane protein